MPAVRNLASRRQRRVIRALHRQDPRAVDLVLEAFGPVLRGYLTNALKDRADVDDVLQQTLLDVWRRGAGFDRLAPH